MRIINKTLEEMIPGDGVPVKYKDRQVGKAFVMDGQIRVVIDDSNVEDEIKSILRTPQSFSISVKE